MPEIKSYPSGIITGDLAAVNGKAMYESYFESIPKEVAEWLPHAQRYRLGSLDSVTKYKICLSAAKLFGNIDEFMKFNLEKNRRIHGANFDFLVDTVEFINGGIRSMSVGTWNSIYERNPEVKPMSDKPSYTALPLIGTNYIAKWLRQPEGLADLVSTMLILFGNPDPIDQVPRKTGLF